MKEEEKALKFMRKYIERVFQNQQVVATPVPEERLVGNKRVESTKRSFGTPRVLFLSTHKKFLTELTKNL